MHRESRFRCSRKTRLTRERAVVRRTRSWTQLVIISTEEIDLKRAQDMYLRKKKKKCVLQCYMGMVRRRVVMPACHSCLAVFKSFIRTTEFQKKNFSFISTAFYIYFL